MLKCTKTILSAIALVAIFGFYGWQEILISQQPQKFGHENQWTTASKYEPGPFAPFKILTANGLKYETDYCNKYSESERKNWPQTYYCDLKITDTYIALFSGLLVFVTIGLVWIGIQQYRDTRILQRAYIAVTPGGVNPFNGTIEPYTVAHIDVKNVGNLPARQVRWFIDAKLSPDGQLNDFPIDETLFFGNNVIPRGTDMPRSQNCDLDRTEIIGFQHDSWWLYIWGEIRYHDGFGNQRFTKFCHRYSDASRSHGDQPAGGGYIAGTPLLRADGARSHQFGNDAN